MLETAHQAAIPTSEASSVLNRGNRFSLVLVRGDGARVFRLSFPRRLPIVVLAGLVVGAIGVAAVVGDWWQARARTRDAGSLLHVIETQRATIAGLKGRMAEVQAEIAS